MTDDLDDLLKRLDCANLYDGGGEVSDLPEYAAAAIRTLRADKTYIIRERDKTFALMLDRAEKAEAEVARLRAAKVKPLEWIKVEDGSFYAKGVDRTYCVYRLPLEPDRWGAVGVAVTDADPVVVMDACSAAHEARILDALTAPADPQPTEPGGFVGDIYFGDPIHTTRGTHRWTGTAWEKLPDETEVLMLLLAKARRENRDAHNAAIRAAVEVCRKFSRAPDTTPEEAAAALDCALRIQDLLRPEGGE